MQSKTDNQQRGGFWLGSWLSVAVWLAFLTLPVLAIFLSVNPASLLQKLFSRDSVTALSLSLLAAAIALAVTVTSATFAAYRLAHSQFRCRSAIITMVELPIVLPPAVAGVGLLAAFGPHSVAGKLLDQAGITLPLTFAGVVVALVFVSAPYYIRSAIAAFSNIDDDVLDSARICGASDRQVFYRVALPDARSGLAAGASLSLARSLGEFGATLMFAGSLQAVTQTAPLAIYSYFGSDFESALSLSALMILLAALLLQLSRRVNQ